MLYTHLVSSYVKVFKDESPISDPVCLSLTALKNDTVSFQTVYFSDENISAKVRVESAFGKHAQLRAVDYVRATKVATLPEHILQDGNYIKNKPFDCPDILRPLRGGALKIAKNKNRTVRIDIDVPERFKAGDYDVKVILEDKDGNVLSEKTQKVTVCNAVLPKATLIHTEWFHTDCIADYYGYEVFSEPHWKAIESFMKTATKRGINMILTPVFTPPLDTEIGGERTTVQLADVFCNNGKWSFSFDRLDRWIDTAFKCGVEYFEINHMFTQWGANAAPKIMATVDGEYKRVFGWDTLVADGAYPAFLAEFLPALTDFLKEKGIAERCYFHVSDEPRIEQIENYTRAKNCIAPYLEGFKLMDALSNIDFYKTGACELPIPCTNHLVPFLEANVPNLWTYYCCGPGVDASNRFYAMTLTRTRAIGVQLFKYNIKGFLHWGYNFYNTVNSLRHIDPFKPIPYDETFVSGDAFVVYPGAGGKCLESARLMAFYAAQADLRALTALAEKTSYEHVMELIEGDLDYPITFGKYPHNEYYYVTLRNKVNRELAKCK